LITERFHKGGYIFGAPCGCARPELDRLRETSGFAATPPGSPADGYEFENLGQPEKTSLGDFGTHNQISFALVGRSWIMGLWLATNRVGCIVGEGWQKERATTYKFNKLWLANGWQFLAKGLVVRLWCSREA
jgi:hypothetical protein